MEDRNLKKRLKKIPDVDKNGDPIYKIDSVNNGSNKRDSSLKDKHKKYK